MHAWLYWPFVDLTDSFFLFTILEAKQIQAGNYVIEKVGIFVQNKGWSIRTMVYIVGLYIVHLVIISQIFFQRQKQNLKSYLSIGKTSCL